MQVRSRGNKTRLRLRFSYRRQHGWLATAAAIAAICVSPPIAEKPSIRTMRADQERLFSPCQDLRKGPTDTQEPWVRRVQVKRLLSIRRINLEIDVVLGRILVHARGAEVLLAPTSIP